MRSTSWAPPSFAFTLAINLTRITPAASLAAALLDAAVLYGLWVCAGRPRGTRNIAAEAERLPPEPITEQ